MELTMGLWNLFHRVIGPGNIPIPPKPAQVEEALEPAGHPEYQARITAEKRFFENYVNIQDLPGVHIYWAHELIRPKLVALGLGGPVEMYQKYLEDQCVRNRHRPCKFVSLGAGNCDIEIDLAKYLRGQGHTHF